MFRLGKITADLNLGLEARGEDPGFHRGVLDQLHNFESNRVAYTNRVRPLRRRSLLSACGAPLALGDTTSGVAFAGSGLSAISIRGCGSLNVNVSDGRLNPPPRFVTLLPWLLNRVLTRLFRRREICSGADRAARAALRGLLNVVSAWQRAC